MESRWQAAINSANKVLEWIFDRGRRVACYNGECAELEKQTMAEDWGFQTNLEVLDRLVDVKDRFVVDAGCGAGHLCYALAERGARVLGVEPDPVQAEKNRQATVVENVGFHQGGAGEIPVEPLSVDGVIFGNSMHHVPAAHYSLVFKEMLRILKSDGFLYVMEPVANGSYQYAIELFHNETQVRLDAYNALVKYALPGYQSMREVYYDVDQTFNDFEEFANHYTRLSYNHYSAEDVRNDKVKQRFESCTNSHGSFTLTQPMRVNVYTGPKQ